MVQIAMAEDEACRKARGGGKNMDSDKVHIPGADPEAPATIEPLLLGLKKCAWLIMVLAIWRLLLCEEFGPFFFGNNRVMDV